MSKPLLDNNAKAKADFKGKMLRGESFIIEISGWQECNANYMAAMTTFTITISPEGVLGCGEPACTALSRFFGLTPTTRSLFSAHKHAVAFHAPMLRVEHVFAQGGVVKKAMLCQPAITKSSSSSLSASSMGFFAISHDDHIAQMQRDQDRSLDQAVQRDAELEHTRLERVVEVRQLTYAGDKPPHWLHFLVYRD
jgi:hypothetical protein